jgi:hypothetical protein
MLKMQAEDRDRKADQLLAFLAQRQVLSLLLVMFPSLNEVPFYT